MRTLIWAPTPSPFGGHIVQAERTVEALRTFAGVDALHSTDPEQSFDGFDLVHGFGLTLDEIRHVRECGLPVALSTIYFSLAYRTGQLGRKTLSTAARERARAGGLLLAAALRGRHLDKARAYSQWSSECRALYESADLLLPNSQLEAAQIYEDLGVTTPAAIVPNAVDPALFDDRGAPTWAQREGVLCVGRIEPHKNQLALIRALQPIGLPLTIVGDPHPHHHEYYEQCRRAADLRVEFVPGLPHGPELVSLYRQAKVHALASRFETTGLVSLEAALAGCAVVTTSRGFARDYFGDDALYCLPDDARSIRNAVLAALSTGPSPALRQRVLERFTWKQTALATAAAYERMLSRGAASRHPRAEAR